MCNKRSGSAVPFLILICILSGLFCTATVYASDTRRPAVAGRFYPAADQDLSEQIRNLINQVDLPDSHQKPVALISPHAGYIFSGQTAAYGYRAIQGQSYETVILLGPSHYTSFHGLSIPDVETYQTPIGNVPLNRELCRELKKHPLVTSHVPAHLREHSIEVQIPFLQSVLKEIRIVPVLVGHLEDKDYPELAKLLFSNWDHTTLIIASSDFTHYGPNYGYVPFAEDVKENLSLLDRQAFQKILEMNRQGFLNFQKATADTICGFRPIALLLEILSMGGIPQGQLLHYTTSGAVTGDFTNTVSYASILFNGREPKMNLTTDEKKTLLRIAREALTHYVRDQKELESLPQGIELTDRLKEPAGAFVTLQKDKQLRGCIGYIESIRPLYQAVIENAVSACSRDYRFSPVDASELDHLKIEISALSPMKEISGPHEYLPEKHGIILEKNGKRAVFLPQVAKEQRWDREKTLEHLCLKAGLPKDAWKEDCQFWVFTAEVFGEGKEE